MKKLITLTLGFFCCLQLPLHFVQAQTLYTVTSKGGNDGGGTINKFVPATNNLTVARSFESFAANPYYTNLIRANDGKLYGMTAYGGRYGAGVIFSYEPSSSTYTRLKDFDYTNGGNPYGSLLQAGDGKLYGMTSTGGSNGTGVIFSFDPSSSVYTRLKDFDDTNGAAPFGSLIEAGDGKLYGVTSEGGSKGLGVIFSYRPSSSTYTKLADFDNTNGANPYGSLMQAIDGNLYGTTVNGGSNAWGIIFSFDVLSLKLTKLQDLNGQDGGNPYGSLLQAGDGKLYGLTKNGGVNGTGVIFSFDLLVSNYTKLKDFSSTTGGNPSGNLIQEANGKLYGLTVTGGSGGYGSVFSYEPSSSTLTKLKDFDNVNGNAPQGSLMQSGNGKLYGMTFNGGSGGAGVIFSFNPSSSTLTKLVDLGSTKGTFPYAGLLHARDGKLYGMTNSGGSGGYGVIFSFDLSSSTYTILKNFDNISGANPTGNLIQASDGKLYGMTPDGGSNLAGVIFSFDPSTSVYTKLIDFVYANGGNPFGSLMQAGNGKLYGTTYGGGANKAGTIFSFDPSSSTYTKLKDLDNLSGSSPRGNLVEVNNGTLYGMTDAGGSLEGGTIFSFDLLTSAYTKLKDFEYSEGTNTKGSFVLASDKKLYGMTSTGGTKDFGTLFSFDPSASAYTRLKEFDNIDGAYPSGSLMQASDGNLYGMTYGGGSGGYGVIFSYDPASSTYTKLKDYDVANGAYPSIGAVLIEFDKAADTPPMVSLTTPGDNSTYIATVKTLKLSAAARDDDGTITKVEFYNGTTLLHTETIVPYGFTWTNIPAGNYTLTAKATDNSGLATTSSPVHITVALNKPPTVSIINPANSKTFPAPATIHLEAAAKDADGNITRVEFYNGSTLLTTERKLPYTFSWTKVALGNYSIIAKAYDNFGAVTTSPAVNISVVPNKAPTVSITNPAHAESFPTPATIHLEAAAQDADGRITTVKFYNGTTLLTTERKLPYSYQWAGIPPGTYTITAVASDNYGLRTTSAPVTITVTSPFVSAADKQLIDDRNVLDGKASLTLAPNPANNILNICTHGLHQDKQATISVLSSAGVIVKTLRLNSSVKNVKLNISSLLPGLYTIKIESDDKVTSKRFVKL